MLFYLGIYSGIKTALWRWQSGKLVTSGDTRVLHPRSHRCYQHKHIITYKRCLWAWQCYAVNKVICWDLWLMIRISLHTYLNCKNFSYQIDNESVCWVQCFSEHANWDNTYMYNSIRIWRVRLWIPCFSLGYRMNIRITSDVIAECVSSYVYDQYTWNI